MADGPILGTTFVEIAGDVSKLAPQLTKAEGLAQQSAKRIEKSVGDSLGNITTHLDKRITASTATIAKLNKSYEETGLATDRNLKKLVAQQIALREAIVTTYGSLSKATPAALAEYNALGSAIQRATLRTRELNHEFMLQRMMSSPAGAPRTLEGAAELGLAQAGFGGMAMRLPQIAAYGFLAAEELKVIGEVGTALGTQWKQWAEIAVHSVDRVAGKIGDSTRDMLAKGWWRFLPGFTDATGTPGGLGGNVDDILKGASYGKWQRYAKAPYHVNPNQYGEAAGPDSSGFVKQLQIQDAINGLKLQEAALTGNSAAMRALNAELDSNKIKELEAGGYTEAQAQAYVKQEQIIRATTEDHKEYAAMLDSVDKSMQGVADATEKRNKEIAEAHELILKFGFKDNIVPIVDTKGVNAATLRQFQGIEGMLKKLEEDYDQNAKHYKAAMTDAIYSVEGLFTNVLEAGMQGKIKSISEAWHSMLDSLEHDIAQFIAHQAVKALLNWAIGYFGGAGATTAGAGATASGGFYANGGIVPGGFRAFASGGKVTQPTIGLVGEGDYNEAVVPLPDGNKIPVQFTGNRSGGEKHEVTLTLDKGLLVMAATAASQDAQRAVLINIREGGPIRRELDGIIRSR